MNAARPADLMPYLYSNGVLRVHISMYLRIHDPYLDVHPCRCRRVLRGRARARRGTGHGTGVAPSRWLPFTGSLLPHIRAFVSFPSPQPFGWRLGCQGVLEGPTLTTLLTSALGLGSPPARYALPLFHARRSSKCIHTYMPVPEPAHVQPRNRASCRKSLEPGTASQSTCPIPFNRARLPRICLYFTTCITSVSDGQIPLALA